MITLWSLGETSRLNSWIVTGAIQDSCTRLTPLQNRRPHVHTSLFDSRKTSNESLDPNIESNKPNDKFFFENNKRFSIIPLQYHVTINSTQDYPNWKKRFVSTHKIIQVTLTTLPVIHTRGRNLSRVYSSR